MTRRLVVLAAAFIVAMSLGTAQVAVAGTGNFNYNVQLDPTQIEDRR